MTAALIESPSPSTKLRYRYKTSPYSHQKKALTKLLKLKGRGGLFMDMATGKTKVAIDWIGIGYHNWGTRKVLVVAPLSVLGVWPRQIRQHGSAPARIFRVQGSTADRVRLLKLVVRSPKDSEDRLTFLIINYESIWRAPDRGASIEDLLIQWGPDVVVFDESHRIKNHTSKQSRSAAKIAASAKSVLLLTGTPITKAPLDAFGQFRAMNPEIFGTNWYAVKFTYGVWGGFNKYQLKGYRHLKELIGKIRKHSFRIKKEDCLDLPAKLFETVPVQLSARERQMYDKMAKEAIIEIEESVKATASIVIVQALRLRQITSGWVKDTEGVIRDLGTSKLNTCMDLVDDLLEEDHKVVIFCEFKHDIERISQKLTSAHLILSGSVPPLKRDSLIDKFQKDPEYKVFIVQIATGSEGIDLTAADAAIYYSLNHRALYYWQSQDRLHRPGQRNNVIYYHLVVPQSVDQTILWALKQKKNLAEAILHKPKMLLGF